MGWLDEQVVVLTGGGSGLGRALVDTLLEEGARVAVLEFSADKATQLREQCDERVLVVQGDAGSYDANREVVAAAVDAFGRVACFIANAGLWDANRGVEAMTPEQIEAGFDDIFRLNVKAPLLGMKAVVDELRASKGSFIVSLSNSALYPGRRRPPLHRLEARRHGPGEAAGLRAGSRRAGQRRRARGHGHRPARARIDGAGGGGLRRRRGLRACGGGQVGAAPLS